MMMPGMMEMMGGMKPGMGHMMQGGSEPAPPAR